MTIDWAAIRHIFVPAEFDDPGHPGSYVFMDPQTVAHLVRLRTGTGWPIVTHNKFGLREAAADGRISAEEADAVKRMAVSRVRSQLPPQVLDLARQGVSSLEAFISTRVERAVREQKAGA